MMLLCVLFLHLVLGVAIMVIPCYCRNYKAVNHISADNISIATPKVFIIGKCFCFHRASCNFWNWIYYNQQSYLFQKPEWLATHWNWLDFFVSSQSEIDYHTSICLYYNNDLCNGCWIFLDSIYSIITKQHSISIYEPKRKE